MCLAPTMKKEIFTSTLSGAMPLNWVMFLESFSFGMKVG